MIEIGRLCVKTAGREAGRFCVVVKNVDDNFVLITGPKRLTKVKRRRCNVEHLKTLGHKIGIKADAPDSEIEKELEKGNVLQKLQAEADAPDAVSKATEEEDIPESAEPVIAMEPETPSQEKEKAPAEPDSKHARAEHKPKPKSKAAAKPAKKEHKKKKSAAKPAKKHAKKKASSKPANKQHKKKKK